MIEKRKDKSNAGNTAQRRVNPVLRALEMDGR
jgi:hypothetical protein